MLKEIFELTTSCRHLSLASPREQPSNADMLPVLSRPNRIAIVAIGNSLIEEDSAALAIMQKLANRVGYQKYCLFNLDSGFSWLKEILQTHDNIVILDSILDLTGGLDPVVTVPLTRDVIETSGFSIRASHGLSWLDELKLCGAGEPGPMTFIGVDPRSWRWHGCPACASAAGCGWR